MIFCIFHNQAEHGKGKRSGRAEVVVGKEELEGKPSGRAGGVRRQLGRQGQPEGRRSGKATGEAGPTRG